MIGKLINLAGRQRMLSQCIVLHVLLASRADEHVRKFIARTTNAIASLESGSAVAHEQVDALVMQAAPLLELLQQITLAYQSEVQGIGVGGDEASGRHRRAVGQHLDASHHRGAEC
ncbi:type IV pili methyl-accepting chemotaxis transducer N-terminal domain-containing protein [Paraburkholderia mimosarum]|uniref:type IV pili methyl-accepting chemotaxis transducer N-terminal domain-containing protein n=1 Tax=Paraburkholderia mimosarum TaxID=312026 RepID=UPI000402C0D8|nr:type IV pili methyl-accepting chemotaxis transducer N-terminal domain-containing protein [Paraburkholderia mimosarum]